MHSKTIKKNFSQKNKLIHNKYLKMEGYDFDGTLFKTNKLHIMSWNKALKYMHINLNIINLPNICGSNYLKIAHDIHKHLISHNIGSEISKEKFVESLCEAKARFILEATTKDIIIITKTINIILSKKTNAKIIISNNRFDFIIHCLKKKRLLKYFSYLICQDYAYCVKTREKIGTTGKIKPEIEAYCKASDYFKLPQIQIYYGNDETDQNFANRLKCKFVLID